MKKKFITCVVIIFFAFAFFCFYYINDLKSSSIPSDDSPVSVEKPVKDVKSWTPSTDNVYMVLKNVKFRFEEDIFINIHSMTSILEPIKPYRYVDMNNANSFSIKILSQQCSLDSSVIEKLFSRYVLNYEGATLKDIKMSIIEMKVRKTGMLKISGMMKLGIWLPFEMLARVGLETSNGRMTIEAEKIKAAGMPFIKGLMDRTGIKLENLLTIKPGKGVSIIKNTMYVEALKLIPSPKLSGNIIDVQVNVKNNCIDLKGGEEKPSEVKYSLLATEAKNYIYIFQGSVIFGKLLVSDGRTQLVDTMPSDYLDFYLKKYLLQLSRSEIRMTEGSSLIVYMPDYQSIVKK